MKDSSSEILKKLPDFDDMMGIANNISELLLRKLLLEREIHTQEAIVINEAIYSGKYLQNGKPPSMSFIESTWKYTGFANEILPIREKLFNVIAELEGKKLEFEIYRTMLDVWKTLSYNERSASI